MIQNKHIWKGTTHITINILGTTMHHPSKMNPWKCNKQHSWVTMPNGDQESTGPSLVACASWYLMELYYSFPQPGAFCAWMNIDFWIFRRRCVYTVCIPLITEHYVFTTSCVLFGVPLWIPSCLFPSSQGTRQANVRNRCTHQGHHRRPEKLGCHVPFGVDWLTRRFVLAWCILVNIIMVITPLYSI